MYNVLTRSLETEVIPACHRYGIDVVVYNPLAGGLLTEKSVVVAKKTAGSGDGEPQPSPMYKIDEIPKQGRYSDIEGGKHGQLYRERYFKKSMFEALQHVYDVATAKHGIGMVETAMRWLVHHSALNMKPATKSAFTDGPPTRDGVVIGVSSEQQLNENLDALESTEPLPDEVVKALDEAWAVAKGETPTYWHLDLKYTYDPQEALFGKVQEKKVE